MRASHWFPFSNIAPVVAFAQSQRVMRASLRTTMMRQPRSCTAKRAKSTIRRLNSNTSMRMDVAGPTLVASSRWKNRAPLSVCHSALLLPHVPAPILARMGPSRTSAPLQQRQAEPQHDGQAQSLLVVRQRKRRPGGLPIAGSDCLAGAVHGTADDLQADVRFVHSLLQKKAARNQFAAHDGVGLARAPAARRYPGGQFGKNALLEIVPCYLIGMLPIQQERLVDVEKIV